MRRHNEFEDIIDAIRRGGIDALVVSGQEGDQILVLQGADHPYRVLVENLSEGAATLDSSGNILYANDRFAEILGAPGEQLVGSQLPDRVPSEAREALASLIRDNSSGEVVLHTAGDIQRTFRFSVSALKVKGSAEKHLCLIATELTEMVEVTKALKSTEQSLQELSARILSLQDEERRRIARDLHDVTGQSLAAQAMMLGSLVEQQWELDPEVRKVVSECSKLNERITDEVRTLSYLLHPPLIEERGLAPAIEWYVAGFSARSGINISVEADPDFPRLTPAAEIALFRVVQESLTNVHRYSGSSRAHVSLRNTETHVVLEIRDFGKGISSEIMDAQRSKTPFGVGILGMRERVRQLSGTLEIVSNKNQGTLVTVHLPIPHAGTSPAGAPPTPLDERHDERRGQRSSDGLPASESDPAKRPRTAKAAKSAP